MRSGRFFGVGLSHSSVINCGFHSHNTITKGMTHELRKIEATDRRCHRSDLAAEGLPARDGAGFPGFFRRAFARNLSTSASTVAVSERIRSACKTTRSIAETLAGQRPDLKVATAATCWIVAPTETFQCAIGVMSVGFLGVADEYFWVLNLYGGRNSAPKPVLNALHSTGFCVKPKQPRNFSRSTEILDLSFSVHKQSLNAVFSFCQLIVKQHGV